MHKTHSHRHLFLSACIILILVMFIFVNKLAGKLIDVDVENLL